MLQNSQKNDCWPALIYLGAALVFLLVSWRCDIDQKGREENHLRTLIREEVRAAIENKLQ